MRTEILTIAGIILGLAVLVGGLPFAGWLIQRGRRKPRVLVVERTEEMAGLHEAKLTALEKAEARLDAAWATYTSEHDVYVRAYAQEHGVEDELLAGAR